MAGLAGKGAKILCFILFILIAQACSSLLKIPEATRIIEFSGRAWMVKANPHPRGPGPNYFSDLLSQVWVDEHGWLHLTIKRIGEVWYCSEIISMDRFSYGTYSFQLATRVDNLDPQVVLGLFTWNPSSFKYHREVDIEFAKWGEPLAPNGQFAVQPSDQPGNLFPFHFSQEGNYTSHEFTWGRQYFYFNSTHGHVANHLPRRSIAHWLKNNWPPLRARKIQVRMNCWLYRGLPPQDLQEVEVVIKNFSYLRGI